MTKLLVPILLMLSLLGCERVSRSPIVVTDANLLLRTNVLRYGDAFRLAIMLENRSAELPVWANVEFGDCASIYDPVELALVNKYGVRIEQAGDCGAADCTYSGPKYVLLKPGESFRREVRLCGISGEAAAEFGVDATYEDKVDTPPPPPEGSYVFRRRIHAQRAWYDKRTKFGETPLLQH